MSTRQLVLAQAADDQIAVVIVLDSGGEPIVPGSIPFPDKHWLWFAEWQLPARIQRKR